MSLSPSTAPVSTAQPAAPDPRSAIEARMRSGASWFITIAILSGINSLLEISNASIRFVFGLGVTQVVDAFAKQSGNSGRITMILVNGAFIALLVLCGRWAKAKSQGAFLGGMILYAVDGLLLLFFQVWLDAAVHAYALWRIYSGYSACRELATLNQVTAPGLPQVKLD